MSLAARSFEPGVMESEVDSTSTGIKLFLYLEPRNDWLEWKAAFFKERNMHLFFFVQWLRICSNTVQWVSHKLQAWIEVLLTAYKNERCGAMNCNQVSPQEPSPIQPRWMEPLPKPCNYIALKFCWTVTQHQMGLSEDDAALFNENTTSRFIQELFFFPTVKTK